MAYASIDEIADRYGGRVENGRVLFQHGGVQLRASVAVSSGVPDDLVVTLVLGPLPRILLRTELASDRTAKRWRLAREVQLGDPAFDDAVYVDARADDAAVRHMLARPEARAAAMRALKTCQEIRMDEDGMQLLLPGPEQLDLDRFARAIDDAVALARALPPDAARWVSRTAPIGRALVTGAGVVAGIVSVLAWIVGLLAVSAWPPIDYWTMLALGLVGSGALWVVVVLFLVVGIRGRSDAHTALPVATILAFAFAIPFGPCGLLLANVLLDVSPEVEYALEPLEWHTGQSDDDPYVWVRFRSFRDPEDSLDLRFEGGREPDGTARVHVFTHTGGLGFPWIASARLDYGL